MTFLNRLYARLRELLAERGGLTDRDFKDAVKVARGHTGGKAKAEAMAALLAAEGDPTGVAVVLPLPQELAQALALAGGLPAEDLHLTIGMIGRRDEMTDVQLAEALLAVRDAGICCAPITATIGGIGRFMASDGSDAKDVVYLSVDSPALLELRDEVEDALEARGLELQTDHGFTPHITLAYIDPGAAMPLDSIEPQSVTFAVLALWAGPQRSVVALIGSAEQDEGMVEVGDDPNAYNPYAGGEPNLTITVPGAVLTKTASGTTQWITAPQTLTLASREAADVLAIALRDPDAGFRKKAEEITLVLAERSPVALPDPRWGAMAYGIRLTEEYLRAVTR